MILILLAVIVLLMSEAARRRRLARVDRALIEALRRGNLPLDTAASLRALRARRRRR